MDDGTKEVVVGSWWGALASLVLFQILGYFIFHSFLYYYRTSSLLWAVPWLFVLILCERETVKRIFAFKNQRQAICGPGAGTAEMIKLSLIPLFIILWIFLLSGRHPLPVEQYTIFSLILFYVFTWVCSTISAKGHTAVFKTAVGKNAVIGLALGTALIYFGGLAPETFFVLSMIGISLNIVLLTGLLVRKN